MREESPVVEQRIRAGHPLIISGAFSSGEHSILTRFGRGYTDAHAGRFAASTRSTFLVHKEYPLCTGDPRIVPGRHILRASLDTVRASLHPLVAAQFLNPHVFSA